VSSIIIGSVVHWDWVVCSNEILVICGSLIGGFYALKGEIWVG
jgi:hypothetical protein